MARNPLMSFPHRRPLSARADRFAQRMFRPYRSPGLGEQQQNEVQQRLGHVQAARDRALKMFRGV